MPKKLTKERALNKAMITHNGKYDYSAVGEFSNISTKIDIICHKKDENGVEHGLFAQTLRNHIYNKQGCPICAKESRVKQQRFTLEQFIKRAREIHGNKYDYSKAVYIKSSSKVKIICPEHGEFWQEANSHLQGQGCPKCKGDKMKKLIYGVGIDDLFGKERNEKIYGRWRQMLNRCYNPKFHKKQSTYADCSVCEEWLTFSNYQKWFEENYIKGYALDKDILTKGNKIYSPETCCFVPQRINNLIRTPKNGERGNLIGVTKWDGKYISQIGHNRKKIGYFDTPEEAFQAYKNEKERLLKEIAQEYFDRGEITNQVYEALMRYEVEPDD